jgi:hypothetical protein
MMGNDDRILTIIGRHFERGEDIDPAWDLARDLDADELDVEEILMDLLDEGLIPGDPDKEYCPRTVGDFLSLTAERQVDSLREEIKRLRDRLRWIPVGEGPPPTVEGHSDPIVAIIDPADAVLSPMLALTEYTDQDGWDHPQRIICYHELPPLPKNERSES